MGKRENALVKRQPTEVAIDDSCVDQKSVLAQTPEA
jgi:hypothetical protein